MTRDGLDIGPAVHAAVPRVTLVAVVAAAVWWVQPVTFWQWVAVVAAAVGAAVPRTMACWIAIAIVPLGVIFQPVDLARTAIAILAVHLGHVLATLILTVPWRSRIALAALRPTARRFLGVQLLAQAVGAAAVLMPAAVGRPLAWLAPVGAVAVALFAVLIVRRAR